MSWVVLLRVGPDRDYAYGPMEKAYAERFATFLTAEVDPARAVPMEEPAGEFLSWYDAVGAKRSAALAAGPRPEHWPPQAGDIWQGSGGERWTCSTPGARPYLTCLAFTADDSADEVDRKYGPMTLVYRPAVREEEPPF